MKKAAVLVISALVLAAVVGCKTQPPAPSEPPARPEASPVVEPAPEPAQTLEKPAATPAPARPLESPISISGASPADEPLAAAKPREKPVPLAESDVQRARDAIARARAADAAYYERELLAGATTDFDTALTARGGDPDRARVLLASSVDKADRAYTGSLKKGAADLEGRWVAMDTRLRDESADKFLVAPYRETVTQWQKAASTYVGGDVAAARALAYAALKAQVDLHDRLAVRLSSIESLRRDVDKALDEAEKEQADRWAARELQETNRLYLLGVEAYQAFRLDESEEYYGAAREAGLQAANVARQKRTQSVEQQRAEAEKVMRDVMAELEAASRMTVVTDDGTVILPKEWSGEDILRGIEGLEKPAGSQSLRLPEDGSTAVLGDTYEENLLEQAKELWRKGLVEKEAGNYTAATEYFRESQRYVEVYRSQAVKGVYTVRWIPELPDCLWRIAAYDFVYGDPYLWPKIWRRNRKLIQNPDLIYPGWLLVIPPEDAAATPPK